MPLRRSVIPAGVVALALLLSGCGSESAPATTTAPSTTTSSPPAETSTTTLPDCPPAPYEVGVFPERVSDAQVPAEDLTFDEFTSVPGTNSKIWVDDDGALAVALVRGTLPPRQWPGEKGEVSIDGAAGVAGPFEDGMWVVSWFEQPGARCDQYTMVFYPPVEPAEVEATIASLDRVAG